MSRSRYVYEDPSIGAIISAVAVVDFILGERHYESYLKQTTGGPGDLSLAYKNAKVAVIEFKAPELATCGTGQCWRYEIGQVNSKLFNAYLELAKSGLLFLGLIHGLVRPYRAPSNGKATFRHAPLTTAFVPPNDAGRCLTMLSQKNTTTLNITSGYIWFRYLFRDCDIDPRRVYFVDLTRVTYRRDFVWRYFATCTCERYACNYAIGRIWTQECGQLKIIDLANLLCCLIKCKFGKLNEEAKDLLKMVASYLQEAPHKAPYLYVLTSTLELIPLRDFIDMMEGGGEG